ncbi:Domain of unknown function DUF2786 [uncultured Caudovirales phage]|uniref:Uncharacterized protein n=1 Tax=uncultured Caudovirales phage TaxID=2100421 RepID=A0A6J5M7N8_9CAUD|nr:Domain of unknown function DUF2786 [uncultured Caudovirales phage]
MAMTTDEVISKVQKLMALANNAGATPAEAERAMVQAKALLRKYELDMADVLMKKMESEDTIVEQFMRLNPSAYGDNQLATLPIWIRLLMVGVQTYTRTRMFFNQRASGNQVMFAGMEHDVAIAKHMIQYLIDATYHQATKDASCRSKADRSSFRYGMAAELQARLKQLRKDEDKASRVEALTMTTGTSLMVIDQKKEELLAARYGEPNIKKATRAVTNAYRAGREAGAKQSLNRQLTGQRQALLG